MDAENVKSGAAEQSPHNPSRSFILNLTYLWCLTLLNRFDLLNGSSAGNLKIGLVSNDVIVLIL